MPEREEIVRSLFGAYRLARLDPTGFGWFNISVDGFWRSFFAAVLVAPGYAILVADSLRQREAGYDLPWAVAVESIAYVLAWSAFPLAALGFTLAMRLTRNYVPLVIAANWAAVLQIAVFLAALGLAVILPDGLGALLLTAATISILFYQWYVFRTALETTGQVAFALVLIDLVATTLINLSAEALI